jgi:predicted anti-sigma-YlaC factor YlaD
MKCERARKLISDDIDGRLSGKRAEALERHIQSCAACRAYRGDVAIIQARSKAQPAPSLSPEDWARIERDLERELGRAPRARYRTALFPGIRLRLAWVGAAVLLVGAMVFYLTKSGSAGLDAAFLSYEGSLGRIYGETRDDPELADSFNRLVLADIGDTIRAGHSELPVDLLANPYFLEGWVGDTWDYRRDENGPDAP